MHSDGAHGAEELRPVHILDIGLGEAGHAQARGAGLLALRLCLRSNHREGGHRASGRDAHYDVLVVVRLGASARGLGQGKALLLGHGTAAVRHPLHSQNVSCERHDGG